MSVAYTPERGDLVWIDLDPQTGREQRGRRPAVVVSPAVYNARSPLAWLCPVTSKKKGYPFEVDLAKGLPIQGVVLVDARPRGAGLAAGDISGPQSSCSADLGGGGGRHFLPLPTAPSPRPGGGDLVRRAAHRPQPGKRGSG